MSSIAIPVGLASTTAKHTVDDNVPLKPILSRVTAATATYINGVSQITLRPKYPQPKCQNLGDAANQLGFRGRGKMGRKALRNLARGR